MNELRYTKVSLFSDLRQQKGYCCYQKVKVEMGTEVSLAILSEKQIEIY